MTQIIPALLVHSEEEFKKNFQAVEHDCSLVQLDVLDNTLFPNTTWHDPKEIGVHKTDTKMEVHFMVENPIPLVEHFKQYVSGFTRAIVSAEMHRPLGAVVGHIRDIMRLSVGVAINPETPLHEIEEILHEIDQITIMSVHPGFQGQAFGDTQHLHDPSVIFEKIKQVRNHRSDLTIEIDGGVTEELIRPLMEAGADRICVGSLIFASPDPQATLQHLNSLTA